jgi:hypothetical protein
MGTNAVFEFHTQFHKFVEVLRLISILNETSLEFIGEFSFEHGILHLAVVIQNCYQILKFSILNAKLVVPLHEVVKFPRSCSNLIRVVEGSFKILIRASTSSRDILSIWTYG